MKVKRNQDKAWIKSWCENADKEVHLMRLKPTRITTTNKGWNTMRHRGSVGGVQRKVTSC